MEHEPERRGSEADGPAVEQLIHCARGGSAEALESLIATCRGYLLLVANQELSSRLRPKAAASDLVQDTFVEAQQGFARFAGRSQHEFLAWLRRILLNNLTDLERRFKQSGKRQIDRELPIEEVDEGRLHLRVLPPHAPSPSQRAMAQERDEQLERAIAELPADYRAVILLHHHHRLSFEEVACQMDRSVEAVRKLWYRAISQLQQRLGDSHAH